MKKTIATLVAAANIATASNAFAGTLVINTDIRPGTKESIRIYHREIRG